MHRDWPRVFADCNDNFNCTRDNPGSWSRSCLQQLQQQCFGVFGSTRIEFIVSYLDLHHLGDLLNRITVSVDQHPKSW